MTARLADDDDVLSAVLAHVELDDLERCAQVCTAWRTACCAPPLVWARVDAAAAPALGALERAAAAAHAAAAAERERGAGGGGTRPTHALELSEGAIHQLGAALALAARAFAAVSTPPAALASPRTRTAASAAAATAIAVSHARPSRRAPGISAWRLVSVGALCVGARRAAPPQPPPSAEDDFAARATSDELPRLVRRGLAERSTDGEAVRAEIERQVARHFHASLRRAWSQLAPRERAAYERRASARARAHARARTRLQRACAAADDVACALARASAPYPPPPLGTAEWASLGGTWPALAAYCAADAAVSRARLAARGRAATERLRCATGAAQAPRAQHAARGGGGGERARRPPRAAAPAADARPSTPAGAAALHGARAVATCRSAPRRPAPPGPGPGGDAWAAGARAARLAPRAASVPRRLVASR